jgi:hypothetical protein
MSLVRNIASLATRIALELKAARQRIGALEGRLPPGETVVTPGHPGVAKAWACFATQAQVAVLRSGFNIARVERQGVGRYRVHFQAAMANADYCWQAFARNGGQQTSIKLAIARVRGDAKTAQSLELSVVTTSGTPVDSAEVNIVVYA